ncbi:hypothetical protein LCGC14_0394990 [marine sediment metagenome]|uniref:Uncharacterized protein n=1 Tax=marine sediment metagenome TaxID=412755 RepID=A0A0F9T409_9ZZZZ
MTEKIESRKPRTVLISTIISITVGILVIAGRFWSIASSATEVRIELRNLKEDIVELKQSHTTFKDIAEKLGNINVRLGKIETRLDIEK